MTAPNLQSVHADYEDREDISEMPPTSTPSFAMRHEAAKQISALLGREKEQSLEGAVPASQFESIEVRVLPLIG